MEANAVVEVTPEGKLDLPPEIQHRIKPGDRYQISMTDNSIVLEKILQPMDVDECFQHIEELGPDPDRPSLEEISDLVKEVRRERRSNLRDGFGDP
ncbi:MAG: hypothetical protein SXA11_07440 [Cyanobacteriota bacterium]|nr:hypothetical protein [Cyanobacteriota bacterium]